MKNLLKKGLLCLLIVMLSITLTPVYAAAGVYGFTDVSSASFYSEAISWAVDAGIASGFEDNTFRPNQTCTSCQILILLWRSCGSPAADGNHQYTDVPKGIYYEQVADWAYQTGLVTGTQFQPEKPCTRSMAVNYMWQVYGRPQVFSNTTFSDVSPNAAYAQAVAWAAETGITSGTEDGTTFSPNMTCTRGQIVTFLHRNALRNSSGTSSPVSNPTSNLAPLVLFDNTNSTSSDSTPSSQFDTNCLDIIV